MSLRVAVVGCGKIAEAHVQEIKKTKQANVVAVSDLELLLAEQLAVRCGVPTYYDDFDELLRKEHPDVVHITTPPQSHLPLGTAAIAADCHVYVEKPLAINADEARRLIDTAANAKRKLTVGYTYAFDPVAIAVRSLVREGVLGELVHIESYYGYDLSGPFGSAILSEKNHWVFRLPGMLVHNNLDHALYKVAEFITDEGPLIHAVGCLRSPEAFGEGREKAIDELRVLITGQQTTAYVTFSSHSRPVGHFVRMYGTKNTVHANYATRTVTLDQTSKLPSALGRVLPAFSQGWQYLREGGKNVCRFATSDFHYFAGMNRLISLFYNSILNDSLPPLSYEMILRVSRMLDEIFDQVNQAGRGAGE